MNNEKEKELERVASQLAASLRLLAEKAENGEIVAMAACAIVREADGRHVNTHLLDGHGSTHDMLSLAGNMGMLTHEMQHSISKTAQLSNASGPRLVPPK